MSRLSSSLLLSFLLTMGSACGEELLPSFWSAVLQQAATVTEPGERVVRISAQFLGTPYRAHTLIGSADLPEQLVAEFGSVDCFTLLDYVEALRRSGAGGEFRQRLVDVRYCDGVIAWDHRRHFFTDWAAAPGGRVVDVTAEVGGGRARQATKTLNRKTDGRPVLPGVPVRERTLHFIPAAALAADVVARLRPGDYLGIYSPEAGLDVSHVGIVVRQADRLYLRHASSRRESGKVVDSELAAYLAGKPGIVVLRPQ